jgi:hypothetical protein
MAEKYRLSNIRALLTIGFTEAELRGFCFYEQAFRSVYDQISQQAGKTEIIRILLEHAEQKIQFDALLTWAKVHNPAQYGQHQPYIDLPLDPVISLPHLSASPPPNPFYTGGRINDPASFFGRERLIREIGDELKKRASVSLVGESQMGKSSLLYYLYTTRAKWLPEVKIEYVDLQRVLDEADFCKTVLKKLGENGDTLHHLKDALEGREVILLFDEVERLAEPDFNPRLHDLLRALAQEPQFAMALATQHPLEQVFPTHTSGRVSPFHNIFTTKVLGPFSEVEVREFLAARLTNTDVAFSEVEIEQLLAESQGYPARLQQIAKALFAEKVT